jgi:hypothetical protein
MFVMRPLKQHFSSASVVNSYDQSWAVWQCSPLYYSPQIPEHNVVWYLFLSELKRGGCATAIVYFQGRYPDR